MFDIYWALTGEKFTVGLIFLLAFYLSSSLVEWQRILQSLSITWAIQIGVKSLVLLLLALIARDSGAQPLQCC